MPVYDSHAISLYCDRWTPATDVAQEPKPGEHWWGEFPAVFSHPKAAACRQQAKRAGWRFTRDGKTFCPRCARAKLIRP